MEILDVRSCKVCDLFPSDDEAYNYSSFTDAYTLCMLWADSPEGKEGEEWRISNVSEELALSIKQDCAKFYVENILPLDLPESTIEQAGHDFWLTRQGHGAGFFDREDDVYGKGVQDHLQEKAKEYKEVDLYMGDDGKIYGV